MKIIYALIFCALFAPNVFAQTDETEIGVEEIQLARAVGTNGELSEPTTIFTTTDVPIYCSIKFGASGKAAAVKMNFVAVSASGLKPNSVVVSVNYKTNGKETGVNFEASPGAKVWAAGKYRVDILFDGKASKSLGFEIQKSAGETAKEKPSAPKPKTPTPAKQRQKPRKTES